MQGFKVSVAEILGHPGRYRDVSVRGPLAGVETALARLDDEPLEAGLRLESVVEGVLVTGRVKASARFECARCLKPLEGAVALDVCELFLAPGSETAVEEDAYRVTGLELNLEPMLRDAVTLALPLKPVCDEHCKGLCATCGKDLNAGVCECVDEDIDPRWAALSELRDKLA